jgi:hypothetical protein
MAKLSEYVAQAQLHGLTVCTRITDDSTCNRWEKFLTIWFEDKHGHMSRFMPCDFGLPGIVRGFEREDNES